MILHTQSVNATAPRITTTLMIKPTGLRHSLGFVLERVCPPATPELLSEGRSSVAGRFDGPGAANSSCPLWGSAAPGDGLTRPSFSSCAVGGVTGTGAVGGEFEFSIGVSGFEKDQPHSHRPQNRHAEINKRGGTQVRIELKTNQKLANNDGQNE